MTKNDNAAPPAAIRQGRPPQRGIMQYLLAGLLIVYLAIGWRYVPSLLVLLDFGMISPFCGLLMLAGSAFLVLGVLRSLFAARLGKYCLLFGALELLIAAPQIGQWDYRLSQGLLATLVCGAAIGLWGAWMAHRAGRRVLPK
jgi:hypothetical protein